jgi:hypothetical protein
VLNLRLSLINPNFKTPAFIEGLRAGRQMSNEFQNPKSENVYSFRWDLLGHLSFGI